MFRVQGLVFRVQGLGFRGCRFSTFQDPRTSRAFVFRILLLKAVFGELCSVDRIITRERYTAVAATLGEYRARRSNEVPLRSHCTGLWCRCCVVPSVYADVGVPVMDGTHQNGHRRTVRSCLRQNNMCSCWR